MILYTDIDISIVSSGGNELNMYGNARTSTKEKYEARQIAMLKKVVVADDYGTKYIKLSRYDRIALVIAKTDILFFWQVTVL